MSAADIPLAERNGQRFPRGLQNIDPKKIRWFSGGKPIAIPPMKVILLRGHSPINKRQLARMSGSGILFHCRIRLMD
jgi:hypothetical protein